MKSHQPNVIVKEHVESSTMCLTKRNH